VLLLAIAYEGGARRLATEIALVRPGLFWLFLGGFCWVIGDLFQQYAAKYIGIGRGIPLSNTNQLWGLAWGALVFGETRGAGTLLIAAGSVVMAAGAWAISSAEAPQAEKDAWSNVSACAMASIQAASASTAIARDEAGGRRP
jgi:glucose uptake protein GlcU